MIESSNSSEDDSDVSSFHSDESYETINSSEEYDSSYDSSYDSRFECPHDTDDECTCSFPSDYSRWSRSSSLREHTESTFKGLKLTENDGIPYYTRYHIEKTGTKRIKKKWKPVYRKWVSIHSKTLETNKYNIFMDIVKKSIENYNKNQTPDYLKQLYKKGKRLAKIINYL
jgi:hypothetical protein